MFSAVLLSTACFRRRYETFCLFSFFYSLQRFLWPTGSAKSTVCQTNLISQWRRRRQWQWRQWGTMMWLSVLFLKFYNYFLKLTCVTSLLVWGFFSMSSLESFTSTFLLKCKYSISGLFSWSRGVDGRGEGCSAWLFYLSIITSGYGVLVSLVCCVRLNKIVRPVVFWSVAVVWGEGGVQDMQECGLWPHHYSHAQHLLTCLTFQYGDD